MKYFLDTNGVSALENNAVLITNNANHLQRIPNLKIEVLN